MHIHTPAPSSPPLPPALHAPRPLRVSSFPIYHSHPPAPPPPPPKPTFPSGPLTPDQLRDAFASFGLSDGQAPTARDEMLPAPASPPDYLLELLAILHPRARLPSPVSLPFFRHGLPTTYTPITPHSQQAVSHQHHPGPHPTHSAHSSLSASVSSPIARAPPTPPPRPAAPFSPRRQHGRHASASAMLESPTSTERGRRAPYWVPQPGSGASGRRRSLNGSTNSSRSRRTSPPDSSHPTSLSPSPISPVLPPFAFPVLSSHPTTPLSPLAPDVNTFEVSMAMQMANVHADEDAYALRHAGQTAEEVMIDALVEAAEE